MRVEDRQGAMLGSEPERVPVTSQTQATPQPNTPHRKKSDFLFSFPEGLRGRFDAMHVGKTKAGQKDTV